MSYSITSVSAHFSAASMVVDVKDAKFSWVEDGYLNSVYRRAV
jgi:hypothetical protein